MGSSTKTQLDPAVTSRTGRPAAAEYTLVSNAQGTLSGTDHVLDCKAVH